MERSESSDVQHFLTDNRNNQHEFDGWEWVGAAEEAYNELISGSSSTRSNSASTANSEQAYPTSGNVEDEEESGFESSSDTSSDDGGPMSDDDPPPGLDSVETS